MKLPWPAGRYWPIYATLEGKTVQLAALARLREDLTKRLEKTGVSDEAEDRHIAIEDALAKAHATLQKS